MPTGASRKAGLIAGQWACPKNTTPTGNQKKVWRRAILCFCWNGGEAADTPPAIWVQGKPDVVHDYRDLDSDVDVNEPERFARNYRKAGGQIDVLYVDYDARLGRASLYPLSTFFRKHLT